MSLPGYTLVPDMKDMSNSGSQMRGSKKTNKNSIDKKLKRKDIFVKTSVKNTEENKETEEHILKTDPAQEQEPPQESIHEGTKLCKRSSNRTGGHQFNSRYRHSRIQKGLVLAQKSCAFNRQSYQSNHATK